MKTLAVIPARFASTRFEGKVIADLCGKPLIQHVWERTQKAELVDDVIIACDDEKVLQVAQGFGATAVMTSPACASGSDRVAEVAAKRNADVVINVQGDEPLIDPDMIDDLIYAFEDPICDMVTAISLIKDEVDILDPNVVKAVVDQEGYAIYFSRTVIPFDRDNIGQEYWKHFGIYAYRKDFLMKYCELPQTPLEQSEKLEQLRVIESGYRIKVIRTNYQSIGVDTAEDLEKVEFILKGE